MVNNTFQVTGWEADASETIEGSCTSWCTSHLNIIPARAAGTWRRRHQRPHPDAGISDGVGHPRHHAYRRWTSLGEQISFKAAIPGTRARYPATGWRAPRRPRGKTKLDGTKRK